MSYIIIQLLVLSSSISLITGEALTDLHINGTHLQVPRAFPCPNAADIAPCVCIIDESSKLILDCTDISSDEELANIFTQEFPVNDFYEFRMNSSSVLTTLNFTCGGVKFQRFDLYPGPFPLVDVSAIFYGSCSNADLEYVTFRKTQLTSLVFPPPPLSDKITEFSMDYSNLASVPAIRSNSLSDLFIMGTLTSEIIPGTFDEIPNLRRLYLQRNNIKILKSDSIPITDNGYSYDLYGNGLETIEPGAFSVKGEPPLDSLYIHAHRNLLQTIDVSVFGSLMPYIQTITFYDNPLDCGCDLAWIILNPEYLEKVTNYLTPHTCADGTLLTDLDPSTYEDFC